MVISGGQEGTICVSFYSLHSMPPEYFLSSLQGQEKVFTTL